MDQDCGEDICVTELSVGGGGRQWRAKPGKSIESGS
jgi:hypothetical protein